MFGLETSFWQTLFNLIVAGAVYSIALFLLFLAQRYAGKVRGLLVLLGSLAVSLGTVYLLLGFGIRGWGLYLVEAVTVALALISVGSVLIPQRGLLSLCLREMKSPNHDPLLRRRPRNSRKRLPIEHSVAVELAMDGVAILDDQGRYLYLNDAHVKIYGYESPEELLGETWRILYNPEEVAWIEQEVFPQLQRLGKWRGNIKAKKRNGESFFEEVSLTLTEEGELVCVCRDVTHQVTSQMQLKQKTELLQKVVDHIPVMIAFHDTEGQPQLVNRELEETLGWSQGEFITEEVLAVCYPDPVNRQKALDAIASADGKWSDFQILTRDGRLLETSWANIRLSDGSLMSIGRDVTESKHIQRALQQQLQQTLLLTEVTNEVRQSLDPQQLFTNAAAAIGKAFQVSRCLIHLYREETEKDIPLVAQYLATPEILPFDTAIPRQGNPHIAKLLSNDRALFSDNVYTDPLLSSVQALCQRNQLKSMLAIRTSYQGKANGLIGLHQCDDFRTWTQKEIELIEALASQLGIAIAQANLLYQERQQHQTLSETNQDLALAKQEAEAANRAKSEFLAVMTHELRTPMNAVIGMTQLLEDTPLTLQQQDLVNTINDSGDILLKMINDILDFSKIESGKLELQSQPFDLATCLQSCLNLVRPKAEAKYLNLTYTIDPETPAVIISDQVRLRQILLNLLSNAVKFTPVGEISVTVTARPLSQQHQTTPSPNSRPYALRFAVQDTGIGIPEDRLGRLFRSFSQMDSSITRDYGGTGLGLAIAQRLSELMGGRIWVDTEIGVGSTFSFAIVATVDPHCTSLPQPQATPAPYPQRPNTSLAQTLPLRILLAEDVVMNQKVALLLLKRLGYEADVANNGLEVLTALRNQPYDVVLMDVQMPKLDGLETTKRIHREWSPAHRPRIIAMTARAMMGDREECLKVGMNDYVSKPIQMEALVQALKQCDQSHPPEITATAETVSPDLTPPHPTSFAVTAVNRDLLLQPFKDWETAELASVIPELITSYLEDAPIRFQAIQQAIITSDGSLLYQTAHAMRSVSQMLGATYLAQYLTELESNGRKEQLAEAKKNFVQFQSEYQRVVESLQQIRREYES